MRRDRLSSMAGGPSRHETLTVLGASCRLPSLKKRSLSRQRRSEGPARLSVLLAFQPISGRDEPHPGREEGGQGRLEAARRGSLDGPVSRASYRGGRSPEGFVVVPWWCRVGDALRSCSKTSSAGGRPGSRVPAISSPRRGGMEWFGRNPVGSIKMTAAPTCGGLAILELAPGCVRSGSHSVLARQRISPSRKP